MSATTPTAEPASEPATESFAGAVPRLSRLRRAALAAAVSLFALLWTGGVLSRWTGAARDDEGWLASLFLLNAALIVLLGERTTAGVSRLAAVVLTGFAVEAAGVRFGLPFGEYAYTGVLRPQLFGVPVVMGFAWMTLVAFACDFAWRLRLAPWVAVLCAALLTTATDLVIDPLAANRLGYWRWAQGGAYYGIPFSNFAGWFVTALVACPVLGARGRPNFWAAFVGVAVVLFFSLNALAVSLVPVALVGLGLCAARLAPALFAARGKY
ncbi:MAG: carotenoid biosynthesis protein [Pyrinomonadaceae bacterium]